eukprot:1714795-Rhodomonas_salina.2
MVRPAVRIPMIDQRSERLTPVPSASKVELFALCFLRFSPPRSPPLFLLLPLGSGKGGRWSRLCAYARVMLCPVLTKRTCTWIPVKK